MKTKLDKFLEERGQKQIQVLAEVCYLCEFLFGECSGRRCPTWNQVFEELNKEYKEKPVLTNDEKMILKALSAKGYNFIVRSATNNIIIYESKPDKCFFGWSANNGMDRIGSISAFNHLFQFVKWTDDEPWNIKELLGYE